MTDDETAEQLTADELHTLTRIVEIGEPAAALEQILQQKLAPSLAPVEAVAEEPSSHLPAPNHSQGSSGRGEPLPPNPADAFEQFIAQRIRFTAH